MLCYIRQYFTDRHIMKFEMMPDFRVSKKLKQHLDWLYDNNRLEERQQEGCKPFISFSSSPFHTVQDGEERWGYDAQETH